MQVDCIIEFGKSEIPDKALFYGIIPNEKTRFIAITDLDNDGTIGWNSDKRYEVPPEKGYVVFKFDEKNGKKAIRKFIKLFQTILFEWEDIGAEVEDGT